MTAARLATAIALSAIAASASIVVAAMPETTQPASAEWNFRASLDGKPIGQHRFRVSREGDEREVTSEANFAVKFLGITAYRYHHLATERWRGDCLESLSSSTNDDGKPMSVRTDVRAAAGGNALDVTTPAGKQSLHGCVMSFAYWNPAIQSQSHLLNAQTGQYEPVQVERIGLGSVEVRGQPVQATQFRINGTANPIDVWYSAKGDWLGLDSTVAGGRKLTYRLQ
jgi:Family of unknown function (DUF6134)